MPESGDSSQNPGSSQPPLDELGHPRGTLVIVALFGVLFALGWLAMYLFRFLERGAPHS
jgi:hypothetical protein